MNKYVKEKGKKVFAILRGCPGLGRVISGIEIVKTLRDDYYCETRLFTYYNGENLAQKFGFNNEIIGDINKSGLTDIGILPVSQIGAELIRRIVNWNPDIVLIDGEPLLTKALCMVFPRKKVITLVNSCDIENPQTPLSNNLYFRDCFLSSGITICHGFSFPSKMYYYPDNKLFYINTILRKEIIEMKPLNIPNTNRRISCILGGGTKNATESFFTYTLDIGKKVITLADYLEDINIDIYANDDIIAELLLKDLSNSKIHVYKDYCTAEDMYLNTNLVICRSGRNTVSELLYLNLPALLISAGDDFRGKEQKYNIKKAESLSSGQVSGFDMSLPLYELAKIVKNKINNKEIIENKFEPGNKYLIKILEEFLSEND